MVDGRGVSGLDGDSNAAAAADCSSFLFSVGLGASLMKVDCRTSAGLSVSAFCFLDAVELPTRDADSLLGILPLPFVVFCLDSLEADDDALPGEAVRGVWGSFPAF